VKSLFFSYEAKVSGAYIIRLKGHELSESLAKRCADSCDKVGIKHHYWDAFDGTKDGIHPPENLNPFMKMVKISDHFLTRSEVACALSHISLWAKCVEDDVPLVVLEHDAIMVAPYREHTMYNSISYLGCIEQVKRNWKVLATPPHGSMGQNYHFLLRAHSYSIDPAVAKNMLAHVLKYGINSSLDVMLRADIFPMHQMDVYAYDDSQPENTTILNRAGTDRSTIRNDNLER
jgi:glycosyl transferase family 25